MASLCHPSTHPAPHPFTSSPPLLPPAQFLVSDMGALQYPQYPVHRSCAVFQTRHELLDYEAALGHAAELADALEVSNSLASHLPCLRLCDPAIQPRRAPLSIHPPLAGGRRRGG